MSRASAPPATTSNQAPRVRMRRVLGVPSLVVFGLAYMVPLTVFTTYGLVTDMTGGHLPLAYVVTLAAMLFTAYSYGWMVRAHPSAGSAYTYTRRAFGPHAGFLTGWTLLLDYVFLPMINYLVIGIYLAEAVPAVPAPVWVLASIALVTALNVLGITLVNRMNVALLAVQGVFLAVFVVAALRTVAGDGAPSLTAPFWSAGTDVSAVLAGSAILCLSFLGFDAVSTLAEEAKDARRTIPRAILTSALAGGVLFVVVAWVGHLVLPDHTSFTDVDSASLDVMAAAGGDLLEAFFTAAYVAGCFASAMASQAGVSRILYAMGRDRVLPRRLFGTLHARHRTPVAAVLAVGLVSCLALSISLELAAAMVSFGALVAFSFVNLSVVKHYLVDSGRRGAGDVVRFGVLPGTGVLLTLWLWTSLSGTTFAVGLTWIAVGFVYLVGLTRAFRRPVPELALDEVEGAPEPVR
ncbi:APC family permease [Kineococcus glutinatus]|uniref:Amino acid permease n=1 Tax=Kineococcus glutinatus TaxID=1070872 RepID=A0ABP9HJ02_9ACTN